MIDQFEYRIKRSCDLYTATESVKKFAVVGLRDNPSKGFQRGYMIVPA